MQDTEIVCRLEGIGGLGNDVCAHHWMQRDFTLERGGERLPVDEFHRQVHQAFVGLTEVEDRGDVRMIDLAGVLGFAREALQCFRLMQQGLPHDLDRTLALHADVLGQIHLAHAAFANTRDHTVAPAHHLPDEVTLVHDGQRRPILRAERDGLVVGLATLGAASPIAHSSEPINLTAEGKHTSGSEFAISVL